MLDIPGTVTTATYRYHSDSAPVLAVLRWPTAPLLAGTWHTVTVSQCYQPFLCVYLNLENNETMA